MNVKPLLTRMRSYSRLFASNIKAFTLIELLVVLVIVSIVTAIAVLAFGHFGRGRREKLIVQQFVRVITAAQQQAILTPSVLGMGINNVGYRFYQYEFPTQQNALGRWGSLYDDVFSNHAAFQKVFSVRVASISAFESVKNAHHTAPEIVFLPSGYVTPFRLLLRGDGQQFLITVKNNGVVLTKQS